MICNKCGKVIEDSSTFCSRCGERVFPSDFEKNNNESRIEYYDFQAQRNPSIGLGIASLVLGILSIIFSWTIILPVIFAILSIVFGAIQLSKKSAKGMSIAGIITSFIGLVLVVIIFTFALEVIEEEERTGRSIDEIIDGYFYDNDSSLDGYYFEDM